MDNHKSVDGVSIDNTLEATVEIIMWYIDYACKVISGTTIYSCILLIAWQTPTQLKENVCLQTGFIPIFFFLTNTSSNIRVMVKKVHLWIYL